MQNRPDFTAESQMMAIEKRRNKAFESLSSMESPLNTTIVIPVYNETSRLKCLSTKLEELLEVSLLSNGNLKWNLLIADDGSTDHTLDIIKALSEEYNSLFNKNNLLTIELPEDLSLRKKTYPQEVQMGGALYTAFNILKTELDKDDFVVYTDFDSSVPLWEIGNTLPFIFEGGDVVIGSRRHTDSVVVRDKLVQSYGSKFISIWKDLFPELGEITNDTNGAFLMFKQPTLNNIVNWANKTETYSAAFKTGALAECIKQGYKISTMGITFIDHSEGSHFEGNNSKGRLSVYARILKDLSRSSDNVELADQISKFSVSELETFLKNYDLNPSLLS